MGWFAVERFGAYNSILGPGLAFAGPDCFGCCITFRSITSRVEQILCEIRTKTKDNVFVNVVVAVQQSVIPDLAESAMYKLSNVPAQIDSYVSDVVRSQLPKMTLDEAFEKKMRSRMPAWSSSANTCGNMASRSIKPSLQ